MRKTLSFTLMLLCGACILGTTSCTKETEEINLTIITPGAADSTLTSTTVTRDVVFNMSSPDVQSYSAKARATRAVSTNYLLVYDVVGGEVKQIITRNTGNESTDVTGSTLDPLSLKLSTGSHTLYFLCCAKKFSSYTATSTSKTVVWNESTDALGDTWTYKLDLDVTPTTSAQSFTMNRAVACITLKVTDELPTDMSTMAFKLTKGSWTYDFSTMSGTEGTEINRTITVLTSALGKSNQSFLLYTFCPNDASHPTDEPTLFDVGTLTAKSTCTSGDVVERSISNVPIYINRKTVYTGEFFHNTNSWQLAVEEAWGDNIDKTF